MDMDITPPRPQLPPSQPNSPPSTPRSPSKRRRSSSSGSYASETPSPPGPAPHPNRRPSSTTAAIPAYTSTPTNSPEKLTSRSGARPPKHGQTSSGGAGARQRRTTGRPKPISSPSPLGFGGGSTVTPVVYATLLDRMESYHGQSQDPPSRHLGEGYLFGSTAEEQCSIGVANAAGFLGGLSATGGIAGALCLGMEERQRRHREENFRRIQAWERFYGNVEGEEDGEGDGLCGAFDKLGVDPMEVEFREGEVHEDGEGQGQANIDVEAVRLVPVKFS